MLLFYISQKKIALTNFTNFSKMYYNALFEKPTESGAGADLT
jgi:hypothetical protein